MKILIALILIGVMSNVTASECVYKAVMTDDEIAACRNAPQTASREKVTKPESGKEFASKFAEAVQKANAKAITDSIAEARRAAAATREIQKVPYIGMRIEDAHDFTERRWILRTDVNKTITAYGERQQWVYDNGLAYLYFENGVLTSIQE